MRASLASSLARRSNRLAIVIAILACTTIVHAAPHHVLVLRAEGTADTPSRTSVDTHVLRLARNIDGNVEAGDITLADAAAAAGCNPSDAACKDEILATFGIDEIVTTTVTSSSGQLHVTVRRLARSAPPRSAQTTIPAGKAPDAKLDADIGPLFGVRVAPQPDKAVSKEPPPQDTQTPPPADPLAPPQPTDPSAATAQPEAPKPDMPMRPEGGAPNRRMQKLGIGLGAGFVVLSFVMWSRAASLQNDIDNADTNTPADFMRLRELESDADGFAGAGNLFFVGGVVLAGVSTYMYWQKGRKARAQTARVTPTVFPHGAGIVLSFGAGQ